MCVACIAEGVLRAVEPSGISMLAVVIHNFVYITTYIYLLHYIGGRKGGLYVLGKRREGVFIMLLEALWSRFEDYPIDY